MGTAPIITADKSMLGKGDSRAASTHRGGGHCVERASGRLLCSAASVDCSAGNILGGVWFGARTAYHHDRRFTQWVRCGTAKRLPTKLRGGAALVGAEGRFIRR